MMKKIASILLVFLLLPLLLLCSCDKTDGDIFFMVDGEIYASFLEDGYPADPTKEGYVFAGWYFDEGTWNEPLIIDGFDGVSVADPIFQIQSGGNVVVNGDVVKVDSVIVSTNENGDYLYSAISTLEDGAQNYNVIINGNTAQFYGAASTTKTETGFSETVYVYAKFVKATEK